jgi:hypothetical protein
VALNSCICQGTRIITPAVAGFIIAWAGTAATFYLAGLGFITMATVVYGLRVPGMARGAGGMLVGALAGLITAPFAIAIGGLAVAAFAVGLAMMNREVRNLGAQPDQVETATPSGMQRQQPSPSTADN